MCNTKCCGKGGCVPSMIGKILVIVGGVNWGLVGVGMLMNNDLNLVHMIFGSMPTIEAVVYVLVGLSAVMMIFGCRCKTCKAACAACAVPSVEKPM